MNTAEVEWLQGLVTRTCVMFPKGPAYYLVDTIGLPYEVFDPEEADAFLDDTGEEEDEAVAIFDGIAPIPAYDLDARDLLVGVRYENALAFARSRLTWDRLDAILVIAKRALSDPDILDEMRKELGMGPADMQLLKEELESVPVPETKRKGKP